MLAKGKSVLTLFLYLFLASTAQASTFHVRLHDDLGSLDWNHGEVNSEVVYQLMEGLFRSDAKGLPQPALAKSFQWNQDKTRMKMDLRFSRWSDGKRVCAQDFVDSWNRLRSAGFASPYAHYAAFLASFEAKGCERLEVRFQRPSPEAPSVFAHFVFFPIRLDNLKQNPKAFSDGEGLLVNGPFLVKEWRKNTSLALERNPHYQGKKPRLERVEFLFIAEDSTAKAMFDRGELDWMKEVPLLLRTPALEQSADFRLFPSLIVYYFGLNARGAPELEDPGIRKLLSESDRKSTRLNSSH